jgi:hypothetical protein
MRSLGHLSSTPVEAFGFERADHGDADASDRPAR